MCGIFGAYSYDEINVAKSIYYGLFALQHRGQEGAGIATSDGKNIYYYKNIGLVTEVFRNETLQNLLGYIGIGHVRYSTTGGKAVENCQPFVVKSSFGSIAIAHNGDLVNSNELRRELERKGHMFTSSTDSEVIAQLLVRELLKTSDRIEAIKNTLKKLVGAYSLLIMFNDSLIAVRDPWGFKPLCIGRDDSNIYISSEDCALTTLDAEFIRDVEPGEIIEIKNGELISHKLDYDVVEYSPVDVDIPAIYNKATTCMFEYVYFARPDSTIDGISVYKVRKRIGEILAKEHPVDADVVSPIPDSGVAFALGFSKESGIPYCVGLMKNKYVGRTFILPSQTERELAVRLKLSPIKSVLEGKRVVLVDDSIVRGTTSKRIVNMVRKAGAKEVHLRIGCPKIISPCYYGIDMATKKELIASNKTEEEIAKDIGADSVGYISLEGLVKAIGRKDLCLACLTGKYPTEINFEKILNRE
ncbi:amidophosphoribosyltransferase [Methanocaldococcus fervens]|uniref:Amidophosphoribosyltransferase n=1 Tax=Methanocaldococcus fervens (strain DSM 4213 / JCM 15782 / AG86) TaxID=573064 RepID=C7P6W8_METFA|nr:amidophosphoribosyltransferase [Methanocaldococcus fervens]ACV24300.1 amidophosphoribosyltransferase [Methanocaldococcus fervens AG86]